MHNHSIVPQLFSTASRFVWLVCCIIFSFNPILFNSHAKAAELYFIDAHSQVDEDIDRDELLQSMDKAGIRKSILSARRKRDSLDIADWAESRPDRIVASVRVKGKHYSHNGQKFKQSIKQQVKTGRFNAMSEVLLYHAQKGDKAPEVIIYPDDERVAFLLRVNRKKGWPFIMHIEFASLRGEMRQTFYDKMKTLLSDNADHPFALNHMGQLDAQAAGKLLAEHSNLHVIAAHTNPLAIKRSNQPWINMFQGKELAAEWVALMRKHPDRFIFGLDNVWADQWRNDYPQQVELWRHALQALPPEVAHMFAHGNAERLWRLGD